MPNRTIQQVFHAKTQIVNGVTPMMKYFDPDKVDILDPLLRLEGIKADLHGQSVGGDLPWHPHKGQVTYTYVIEGGMRQQTTLGNDDAVGAGGALWMRASGGVQHKPGWHGSHESAWAYDLWVNLAAKDKGLEPAVKAVPAESVPVIDTDDAVVKLLSGRIGQTVGPTPTGAGEFFYADITVNAGRTYAVDVPQGDTFCVLPIDGVTHIEGEPIALQSVAKLSAGNRVEITAVGNEARCLLIGGTPRNEPIVYDSSYIMNSEEEMAKAKQDYQAGAFGTVPPGTS